MSTEAILEVRWDFESDRLHNFDLAIAQYRMDQRLGPDHLVYVKVPGDVANIFRSQLASRYGVNILEVTDEIILHRFQEHGVSVKIDYS